MSLKPPRFETVDAKATRVIVAHGRAPNFLRCMDEDEREALAALVDEDGKLADGAADKFREVMIQYNERHKATDESFEGEPVSVQATNATTGTKENE